jgi:adenylate cyclase
VQIGRFIAELRRRRVFRVVGAYAFASWVAVEVSSTTLPLLGWSEEGARVILVIALIGFPIVVALSWIFDLTPEGLKRTEATPDLTPRVVHSPPHARALGMFGTGILVALVGFAAYSRYGASPDGPAAEGDRIRSIAVLPFVDMSANQDQEYFADGVTEELLNRLSQIQSLHVAARTSSFAFKGRNEDIAEIGRRLRVQAVLEGSIRREGDRLRITAQLIDARTGYHLWSENYDREGGGVFAIQDEISRSIVEALQLQISPVEVAGPGTVDTRAHDLYLQGLALLRRRSPQSLRDALARFEAAVAEDSSYAHAWAGMAQTFALLPTLADYSFEEALDRGSMAAARAIELDATLAEAHGALGQIAQTFEWDLPGAERAYRRAVRFNPAFATGHQWYAETLLMLGQPAEAEAAIAQALELDPLAPAALAVQGYIALVRGRTAEAITANNDLLRLYPEFALGRLNLVYAFLAAGRAADAAEVLAGPGLPDALAAPMRELAGALAAGQAPATGMLTAIDATAPPSQAALWHMAANDPQGAIAAIQRAAAEGRDGNLPFLLLHPLFTAIRSDDRFIAIVDSIGVKIAA